MPAKPRNPYEDPNLLHTLSIILSIVVSIGLAWANLSSRMAVLETTLRLTPISYSKGEIDAKFQLFEQKYGKITFKDHTSMSP